MSRLNSYSIKDVFVC